MYLHLSSLNRANRFGFTWWLSGGYYMYWRNCRTLSSCGWSAQLSAHRTGTERTIDNVVCSAAPPDDQANSPGVCKRCHQAPHNIGHRVLHKQVLLTGFDCLPWHVRYSQPTKTLMHSPCDSLLFKLTNSAAVHLHDFAAGGLFMSWK